MRKIFNNKEKLIEIELENTKKSLDERLDKLPNEELPFMQPHLRSLYFQAYFLFAYGFDNASLVISGILLESLVKEILSINGLSDRELEETDFGKAISLCEKFLTKDEIEFLKEKKNSLRNPYLHFNRVRLTKGIYVPAWKIPNEEFMALADKRKRGELTDEEFRKELIKGKVPEIVDSQSFKPLATILKAEVDKVKCLPAFLEIDKFVREFAEKYFKKS